MTTYANQTLGRILPFETLKQVFELAFEDLVEEYKLDHHNSFYIDLPLILGFTCRYWRDVVLQTPRLWTFIQIDLNRYDTKEVANEGPGGELLKRWIERSRSLPLQLCIEDFDMTKLYDETVYPLSLFDLDRVWYLSIDSCDQTPLSGNMGYIQGQMRICWNNLHIPRLRSLRLLVPHLLSFALAHHNIQSLVIDWEELSSFNHCWTNWPGDRPLQQLILVSKDAQEHSITFHKMRFEEIVLDNVHSRVWTVLNKLEKTTPIRSFCLRRLSGVNYLHVHAFSPHGGVMAGTYVTKLELTDLAWGRTLWYFTLKLLPNLIELWVEHNGSDAMEGTVVNEDSPKDVIDELPKLHQTLNSLSRITVLSTILVKTSGLTEYARLSDRTMEIVLSPRCLPVTERDALTEIPLVTVFFTSDRRTQGIHRKKRLHIQ